MRRPRHVRQNAHVWAFVILPRIKIHAAAYILHFLSPRS